MEIFGAFFACLLVGICCNAGEILAWRHRLEDFVEGSS